MKVVILGAGQVGQGIARYLSSEENDITVIDTSAETLNQISQKIDIKPIQGYASHPGILAQAQVQNADLFVAVTAYDEVNMVACEIAHSLFSVKTKIARIRHQGYLTSNNIVCLKKNMSIDVVISPEVEVANAMARSTQVPGAFELFSLASDNLKIIGVQARAKSSILNTPLRLITTQFLDLDIEIIAISRKDRIFFPTPDDIVECDDDVYFIVRSEDVVDAMEIFGYFGGESRKIIIVGAGNIGFGLAQKLEETSPDIKVKIIEKSSERCLNIARNLNQTEILNGDALDLDVLGEANVKEAESILALTEDDKVNILVSLLAKKKGARRSVSLLNKMSYSGLLSSLGVDAIVSPRVITVSKILQHIYRERLRTVYTIAEGFAEIIEAEAHETSLIIGLTVEDITIKGALNVIAVIRGQDILIKPTKLIIGTGDVIVILVKKESAKKAEKLFSKRPSYL